MTREADEALVTRLMSRDDDAIAKVMELYGGIVNGMARRIATKTRIRDDLINLRVVLTQAREDSEDE